MLKLLCLSNGHGEDAIALRIIRALQALDHPPDIAALPLVGEGQIYRSANIPVVGPIKAMPSGGFIYMDGKQLARDVQGGLVSLTLDQIKTIKAWSQSDISERTPGGRNSGGRNSGGRNSGGRPPGGHGTSASSASGNDQSKRCILAVGDIVPLLFAWISGVPYAFVGTAKSEYYLRDENGPVPRLTWFDQLENWSGSVYLPWERWLLSRPNCQAVLPRDTLTTQTLRQWDIPAYDMGNPMMDQLEPTGALSLPSMVHRLNPSPLKILLLPGSRAPEAHRNWRLILQAVASVQVSLSHRSLVFVAAIAPSLALTPFVDAIDPERWHPVEAEATMLGFLASPHPTGQTKSQSQSLLLLGQQIFNDSLHQADVAIALAGTATEQFVGLGKPAITLPGEGPQFTAAFAEAQTRLLGPSIIPVETADQVGDAIAHLLDDPEQLERIRQNGQHRMGHPGAAHRIAHRLMTVWTEMGVTA